MTLLLDTHAYLWWLAGDIRLGGDARRAISEPDSEIFVSVASLWEIAIKAGIGRLKADVPAVVAEVEANRFRLLAIDRDHVIILADLPRHHRDPFDRMLIAQARTEELTIVTSDRRFARYDVPVTRC